MFISEKIVYIGKSFLLLTYGKVYTTIITSIDDRDILYHIENDIGGFVHFDKDNFINQSDFRDNKINNLI